MGTLAYNPALDGLRAVSILAVLAFHARTPGFNGGFLGVDVFFVLSGYLITRLLRDEYLATGSIALTKFWARRLMRLYPAMIVMVAAYFAVAPWAFPTLTFAEVSEDAALTLLYLSDYAPQLGAETKVLRQTWSLAAEEHFYLLWPLLALLVFRLSRQRAVLALMLLFVAATLWRWHQMDALPRFWSVYPRFDTHASGLVLGCALGLWLPKVDPRWGTVGAIGLAALVFTVTFRSYFSARYGFTLAEISTALIIMSSPAWLVVRPLPWLGRMSYGMYLWHYPVMWWMKGNGYGWESTLLIGGGFSVVAAAASYYLIERRFRKSRSPEELQRDVIEVPIQVRATESRHVE